MKGIIFFDCDGVLTIDDSSWVKLHKYFKSIDNSYFAELYKKGAISYLDWMKIDIALMIHSWRRPITLKDVVDALKDIKVRDEALYAVKMLKQKSYLVGVISSGIDLLVKNICMELGVDMCLYNELVFYNNELVPGGRDWVPLHEKPYLIKKLAQALGYNIDRVVYIGDSVWDIPVFHEVGLSIAINPCGRACEYADYVVDSLVEIIDIIEKYFNKLMNQ